MELGREENPAAQSDMAARSGDCVTAQCTSSRCEQERALLRDREARLMCVLCGHLPEAPVALEGCGHMFCSRCIRNHLAVHSRCPFPACPPANTRKLIPLRSLDFAKYEELDKKEFCASEKRSGVTTAGRPSYLAPLIDAGKEKLQRLLGEAGLSTVGDLGTLRKRHRLYVMEFNVAIDGAIASNRIPAYAKRRVQKLEAAQGSFKANKAVAGAVAFREMWGSGKNKSEYEREIRTKTKWTHGRELQEPLNSADDDSRDRAEAGDSFDVLIQKIKSRKRGRHGENIECKSNGAGPKEQVGETSSGANLVDIGRDFRGAGHSECARKRPRLSQASLGEGDGGEVIVVDDDNLPSPPSSPVLISQTKATEFESDARTAGGENDEGVLCLERRREGSLEVGEGDGLIARPEKDLSQDREKGDCLQESPPHSRPRLEEGTVTEAAPRARSCSPERRHGGDPSHEQVDDVPGAGEIGAEVQAEATPSRVQSASGRQGDNVCTEGRPASAVDDRALESGTVLVGSLLGKEEKGGEQAHASGLLGVSMEECPSGACQESRLATSQQRSDEAALQTPEGSGKQTDVRAVGERVDDGDGVGFDQVPQVALNVSTQQNYTESTPCEDKVVQRTPEEIESNRQRALKLKRSFLARRGIARGVGLGATPGALFPDSSKNT